MALVEREPIPWGDLDVTIPFLAFVGISAIAIAAMGGIVARAGGITWGELVSVPITLALLVGPFEVFAIWLFRLRLLPGKVWTDGFRPAIGAVGVAGESYRFRGRFLGKTTWDEVSSVTVYRKEVGLKPVTLVIHTGTASACAWPATDIVITGPL